MDRLTDQELLREYADSRQEAAFSELVRRHVDFVHSAAARMVCDAHLAKDVTQSVFIALAQNARQLTKHPMLAGWLHRTAQNIAAQTVRTDVRRRAREQEAAAMNEMLTADADLNWQTIAPHLDAALGELSEGDRDIVFLRYFQRQSAEEIAQNLGISSEAAQKRVNRAVERLRGFLSQRGVAAGATGLAAVISANAIQAAPVGMAASISAAGLAATNLTAATITTAIAMTTLQKTLVTTAIIAAVGTGIYEAGQASSLRSKFDALQQQQTPLNEQVGKLQKQNDDNEKRLAAVLAENKQLRSNQTSSELLKLRGEVAQLRNATNDPVNSAAKTWLARVDLLKQRLAENPHAAIPELRLLTDDDWLSAAKDKLDTDADYRRALSQLRNDAESKFSQKTLKPALDKYADANGGKFPTDLSQLQSYFTAPVDEAMLQRWEVAPAKTVSNIRVGDTIVTETAPVDDLFDSRIAVGPNGYGTADFLSSEIGESLKPVYKAFSDANGKIDWKHFELSQLLPYATTPEQQANVQKMIDQRALRKQ